MALRPHPFHQFPGQLFAQVGVQQFGEKLEQLLGQVVAGGVAATAQLLDHRLQLGQLVLHRPRQFCLPQFRLGRACAAGRGWGPSCRSTTCSSPSRRVFIRALRRQAAGHVHAAGGGDFDLPRSIDQAEEAAGLDFAGVQHGRFGPRSWRTMAKASCIVGAR